jgi:hypothetical protein
MSALAKAPLSSLAAPSSSSDAIGQATEMLDLMMRLADHLTHETERVRSGHIQDVAPLQREKLRLALLYQKTVKELRAGGMTIATLPAPLRAQIVATSARLAEAVDKNERALRIGRDATRRLVDLTVRAARERLKPVSRYDARRAMRPGRMAPCSVDRRL